MTHDRRSILSILKILFCGGLSMYYTLDLCELHINHRKAIIILCTSIHFSFVIFIRLLSSVTRRTEVYTVRAKHVIGVRETTAIMDSISCQNCVPWKIPTIHKTIKIKWNNKIKLDLRTNRRKINYIAGKLKHLSSIYPLPGSYKIWYTLRATSYMCTQRPYGVLTTFSLRSWRSYSAQ